MIDQKTIQEIKNILSHRLDFSRHKAFIFGSQAHRTKRRSSDIDLGIEGITSSESEIIGQLMEDFENSDIPTTVDVVDFSKTSDKFKKMAKEKILPIN